ncbi:MAG: hypothetical protein ABI423_05685 [Burkholderiales bacterium]
MSPRVHRLELDYIVPRRRAWWPGVVLLAVSLALAANLLLRYRDAQSELARIEAVAGLAGPQQRPVRSASKERLDEEVRNAEAVVRQIALPWGTLVRAIEQAATRDVALLQLQPDAQSRLVKLSAEARSRAAMFDYVRRLGATNGLADVHVVSHQVQNDDPRRPVQFSVQASMKATP